MGVVEDLRGTSKGRLRYRKHSSPQQLKSLLDDCSSPPEIVSFRQKVDKESISPASSTTTLQHNETQLSQLSEEEEEKKDKSKDELFSLEITENRAKPLSPVSPEYGKTSLKITQYEKSWDEKARLHVQEKQRYFKQHTNHLQQVAERKKKELDSQSLNKLRLQHEDAERQHSQETAEVQKRHQKLKEDHSQHALNLHAKIQKAEETKQKLQEEEAKKRDEERKERLKLLEKSYSDLKGLHNKIMKAYDQCQYKQHLTESGKKSLEFMKQLLVDAARLFPTSEEQMVSLDDRNKMKNLCERAINAYEHLRDSIEEATKQGLEIEKAAKQQQKEEEEKRLNKEAGGSAQGAVPVIAAAASVGEGEVKCVDVLAFEEYTKYQSKLEQVEKLLEGFTRDSQMKKVRFNLAKAVNTPINAISAISGKHLRERLMRLHMLVSGQSVDISSMSINASQHPQGTLFCKNLIARMIVKKGAEQVSAIHESAFAIGAVACGLLCEHSEVRDLLLAHFHTRCPYIVPYYIPKAEEQTMEGYHMALGYEYIDGVVEKQDKFLKRMSGIMRLYAAILVSVPPKGPNHPHPHGIQHAWIWLSRVLNMEPQPDITATMIYDLLDVAGHALSSSYGVQFQKLLHILMTDFLSRLHAVASQGGSGPVYRLQELLERSLQNKGRIAPPQGLLPSNFWHS